jgi:hypothetical protein
MLAGEGRGREGMERKGDECVKYIVLYRCARERQSHSITLIVLVKEKRRETEGFVKFVEERSGNEKT